MFNRCDRTYAVCVLRTQLRVTICQLQRNRKATAQLSVYSSDPKRPSYAAVSRGCHITVIGHDTTHIHSTQTHDQLWFKLLYGGTLKTTTSHFNKSGCNRSGHQFPDLTNERNDNTVSSES